MEEKNKYLQNVTKIISEQIIPVNIEDFKKFEINLSKIYLNLFYYVLYGNFLENNINIILKELRNLKNNFIEEKDDLNNKLDFLDKLKSLEYIITQIHSLKNRIEFKREKIIEIEKIENNNQIPFIGNLLILLININYTKFFFEGNFFKLSDSIIKNSILFFEEIEEIKSEKDNYNKYEKEVDILEDLVILDLYKTSLIIKTNKFNYFLNSELKPLKIESKINKSIFSKFINEFKLISDKNLKDTTFINYICSKFEHDGNITSVDFFLLVKYYKEQNESKDKLYLLYNIYKKQYSKNESNNNYLNFIFIGNNLLSFLINKFEINPNDKLISEIENIFKELKLVEINDKKYKNFFTDYKYLYFKNLQYRYVKDNQNNNYNLNTILNQGEKSGDDSLNIIEKLDYNNFYEFDIEDNKIRTDLFDENIFVLNLYSFPYNIKEYKYLLNKEKLLLNENKFEYKYTKYFSNIEEKIDNNKLDAIAVIGLFTGIVVYSLGTIQIFAIIEDLGSAIMFAGIFLSGILFLLGGIYYNNKVKFRKNKGNHLFLLAIGVLAFTFIGKFWFSGTTLNSNKANNLKQDLEIQIQKAEILKKELEKLITK